MTFSDKINQFFITFRIFFESGFWRVSQLIIDSLFGLATFQSFESFLAGSYLGIFFCYLEIIWKYS